MVGQGVNLKVILRGSTQVRAESDELEKIDEITVALKCSDSEIEEGSSESDAVTA
jgi:hypothetical protein